MGYKLGHRDIVCHIMRICGMAKEYNKDTGDLSRSWQVSRYAEYVANVSPTIFGMHIAFIIAYCIINHLLQPAVVKASNMWYR